MTKETREPLFGKDRKPPSIWRKLRWILGDVFVEVKNIPSNIKRLVEWFPVIWKDRDWDFAFFLTLMQYKMKRMREYIIQHDILVSSKRVGKQLRYGEYLIDQYFSDEYKDKLIEKHEEKWGKLQIDLVKDPGDPDFIAGRMDSYTTKARKENREEEERQERLDCYRKGDKKQQEMLDRLFRHMRKYIQNWWD